MLLASELSINQHIRDEDLRGSLRMPVSRPRVRVYHTKAVCLLKENILSLTLVVMNSSSRLIPYFSIALAMPSPISFSLP